ncbi:MAG: mmgC18, partial [Aeromicrobium sp.]|nr:mmgC18 [Aeromicrobium sp.]
ADYQELLVRTDSKMSKHRGITWIINDMTLPGVTVRPIETLTGEAHFCEVFYDNVRIPLANVVGGIDNGWSVAMSTLSFERGTAFTAAQVTTAHVVERLIELARTNLGPDGLRRAIEDDEIARRLSQARADVASLRALTYTGITRSMRTGSPGPEGSITKVYYSDLMQEVARLAMDIVGRDGLEFMSRWLPDSWSGYFFLAFSQSIGGGTSEIQRNIIGERVLGLPR